MLNDAQVLVLKQDLILSAVEFASIPNNEDGYFQLAKIYNLNAAPDFFVWRSNVPINEIMSNGFDWTRVDNLTVGKARIWEWMTQLGAVNMAEPNVRAGVNACFSVAGGDAPNRLAVFGHGQRLSTRAEKLFAVGTGTASTDLGVGPATMGYEGPIDHDDVRRAKS